MSFSCLYQLDCFWLQGMDIQKAVLKQLFLSQWTGSLEALLPGLTPQLKGCQELSVFLLCHCSYGHCGASRSKEAATVLLSHLHSAKCREERGKNRAKRDLFLFHLVKESNLPTTFLYILLVNTGSYSSIRTVPGMRFYGWFGCVRIHPPAPRAGHITTQINWECVEKKDRAASSFGRRAGLCRGNSRWRKQNPSFLAANGSWNETAWGQSRFCHSLLAVWP